MAMNGEQSIPGAPPSGATIASQYPIGTGATRASPYPPPPTSTMSMTKQSTMAMPAPPYLGQPSGFRPAVGSQAAFPIQQPVGVFDGDATMPIGTPFGTTPSPSRSSSVLIRRLPLNTSEEQLRLMAVWSQELVNVEVLPVEQSIDQGFRAAIMCFKSQAGAREARVMLHGKSNIANDAEMIVDIINDASLSTASTASSSAASSTVNAHQSQRFNGTYQALDNIPPTTNGGSFASNELPTPHSNPQFQSLFSPRSPIGNHHIVEATRISGKSLIKSNDVDDDDETGELLMNPVAYAENGPAGQRRSTVPQLPISRMAQLSLKPSEPGPSSMPQYSQHPNMGMALTRPGAMSPVVNSTGRMSNFQQSPYPRPNSNFPPINPADQNPPCNTLYVGNLPADTSEEELKAIFSKQRGYKRLCFRTKTNGPMCFVEFEDVSFATKALSDLYGQPLHNSTKGGIRLSFSKNPLGVRSNQTPGQGPANGMGGMNGMVAGGGPGNGFANGPPPGLAAPPGLSSGRMGGGSYGHHAHAHARVHAHGYNPMYGMSPSTQGGWNPSGYSLTTAAGENQSTIHNPQSSNNFLPPHMMGL